MRITLRMPAASEPAPPAVPDIDPVKRLFAYMITCAQCRGDRRIEDRHEFWDDDGQPDAQAARRFAEGMRAVYAKETYGYRVGVRQTNHRVVVRLIPLDVEDADDAVVRAPTAAC